jgi:hypothetical protein
MTKFRSSHYGWIRKTLKPDKKNGGTTKVPPFFLPVRFGGRRGAVCSLGTHAPEQCGSGFERTGCPSTFVNFHDILFTLIRRG